jgi:hypothetical protein
MMIILLPLIHFFIRFELSKFKNSESTHKTFDFIVIVVLHSKSRLF